MYYQTFRTSLLLSFSNLPSLRNEKSLHQRWHECECGIEKVQRDLYSAFLACHVKENHLDINQAKETWSGAHPLLEQAMSRLNQTAIGKHRLASFGLSQSQSGSLIKGRSGISEAMDVVGLRKSESHGKLIAFAARTPLL
jgi:hypothetical protein